MLLLLLGEDTFIFFNMRKACLLNLASMFESLHPTATNSTNNSLASAVAVVKPGTNSTYITKTSGASLVTTTSLSTAQTMKCIFDGTDINAIYMAD